MGDAILESSNSASLVTRHCCQTRSTAVCQFAQHYPAAEIIPTAAAWTDTAMVSNKVTNKGHEKQYPGEIQLTDKLDQSSGETKKLLKN